MFFLSFRKTLLKSFPEKNVDEAEKWKWWSECMQSSKVSEEKKTGLHHHQSVSWEKPWNTLGNLQADVMKQFFFYQEKQFFCRPALQNNDKKNHKSESTFIIKDRFFVKDLSLQWTLNAS